MNNPHIGSDFDEFLEEEGIREEVTAAAIKRVIALTDSQGEVRELTTEDMAKFKPAAEVLPPSLRKKLGVKSLTP